MSASTGSAELWSGAVIVPSLPDSYPRQQGLTCGEANARSVIDAWSLGFEADLNPSPTVRLFGYSLLRDLRSLVEAHGLLAPVRSARRMTGSERLDLLRKHLRAGEPVILAIGNGHLTRDRYVGALRLLVGHYLTLYGFDDASESFLVYDSYLEGDPEAPLPAGNDRRSYAETLRDWRGPLYYPAIGRRYVYIPVSKE